MKKEHQLLGDLVRPPHLRYNADNRIVMYYFFIVICIAIYIFSPFIIDNFYIIQYLALWLLFSTIFLFFANHTSYISNLTGKPNILEIPVYITVMVMGLSTIFGIFPLINDKFLPGIPSKNSMIDGLLLTGFGLLSFWIGYAWVVKLAPASRQNISKPSSFDFKNPKLSTTIVSYGLLCVLRLVLILNGGGTRIDGTDILNLGLWQQWLSQILLLNYFFIALFSLQYARGKWNGYYFYLIIVIELFFSIITGWSSDIIKILFVFLGTQALYKKFKLSLKTIIFSLLAVFLIINIVPLIRTFRSADVSSIDSIAQNANSINAKLTLTEKLNFVSNLLIARQEETSQIPALIMAQTPEFISYRPIEELLLAPLAILPRGLWPDKPRYSDIGVYVAKTYERSVGSESSAVTPAGGFYIYGGYLPVIFGMLITGLACALITRIILVPSICNSQVVFLALYVGTVTRNFHLVEGSFVTIIPELIQSIVVFMMAALLISYRNIWTEHS